MSDPVDPKTVEETKKQIRVLVAEIAELTNRELSPRDYFGEFLTRVISAMAAVGGAVWQVDAEGTLRLIHEIQFSTMGLDPGSEAATRHADILKQSLAGGEQTHVAGGPSTTNPTPHLLILTPVREGKHIRAIVEIFQRAGAAPATQQGYLKFMRQMCDMAEDWWQRHQLRVIRRQEQSDRDVSEFAQAIHESIDLTETAYAVVNETRRLTGCDRVSVAIREGDRMVIRAVSGQEELDRRSIALRLMGVLATKVAAAGDPIWYSGDKTSVAPEIEDALCNYLDENSSHTIVVLPLSVPPGHDLALERGGRTLDEALDVPACFGTLIIEQFREGRRQDDMEALIKVAREHVVRALANACQYDRISSLPLIRSLGRARLILQEKRFLRRTVFVAAAAVVLMLLLLPVDHRVRARGTLEPVRRQVIYAPVDGMVASVYVNYNAAVEEGDVLLDLRPAANPTDSNEHAERAGQSATGGNVHRVTSPMAGRILTWDLRNVLLLRPVWRGQPLLTVEDLNGPWELDLEAPEAVYSHLRLAQRDRAEPLAVSYRIDADPEVTRRGTVRALCLVPGATKEDRNRVRIRVEVDRADLAEPWPGGTAVAAVTCGRRSLAYVWLHPLWELLMTRLSF